MNITPIRGKADYDATVARIEELFDAKPGTPEFDELDILTTLVVAYDEKNFPIHKPDPISVIEFVMEQRGLARKDLEPYIGGRNRVSEILTGTRSLTLAMIRKLNKYLGIPADLLIQEQLRPRSKTSVKASKRR